MGAFELESNACDNRRFNEECIISYKIYDQCRMQICCTPGMLGPAKAARNCTACDQIFNEGDTIVPPEDAESVDLENFKLKRIIIVNKKPNAFKPGFWDIELKFVFTYVLIFKASDGCEICCVSAYSTYSLTVVLFGSFATDTVLASDLYGPSNGGASSDPFVTVEAKAVALAAELKYKKCNNNCDCCCDCGCGGNSCGCGGGKHHDCDNVDSDSIPSAVNVTIGLFLIVKLFRLVNLLVHSSGFCVPEECENTSATDSPCDFFDSLEFPLSTFTPPADPKYFERSRRDKCCDSNSAGNSNCNCRCGR